MSREIKSLYERVPIADKKRKENCKVEKAFQSIKKTEPLTNNESNTYTMAGLPHIDKNAYLTSFISFLRLFLKSGRRKHLSLTAFFKATH